MLPGPTIIRKCSHCGQFIKEETITSGNSCGATIWTDARPDAPMLPDLPWLVACGNCHAYLWINELENIDEVWFNEDKFKGVPLPRTLKFDDYIQALQRGETDPEKLKYLRVRALWAANDKRRKSKKQRRLSAKEIDNIERFIEMLDDSDDDELIMKAELHRELGNYERAIELLRIKPELSDKDIVKALLTLCEERNPSVVAINKDQPNTYQASPRQG